MGKKDLVVVTLGRDLEENPDEILEKGMSDCRKKTFGQVFNYMLNPSEDEDNPEYTREEKEICEGIKDMKNNHSPSEQMILSYHDKKEDSHLTDLSEKVQDYPDAIYETSTINENGEEIPYHTMRLEATLSAFGGFK